MADGNETYEPPGTSGEEVIRYIWYRLVTLWPVKWALATTAFFAVAATYWWGDWQIWSWEVFSTMLCLSALVAGVWTSIAMWQVENGMQKIRDAAREENPPVFYPGYPPQVNLKIHTTFTLLSILGPVFGLLLVYKLIFVAVPWAWRGLWNLWSAVPIESLKDLSAPQWVCIAGVALALLVALAWWKNRQPRTKDATQPIRL
jgi:hypothetical protein